MHYFRDRDHVQTPNFHANNWLCLERSVLQNANKIQQQANLVQLKVCSWFFFSQSPVKNNPVSVTKSTTLWSEIRILWVSWEVDNVLIYFHLEERGNKTSISPWFFALKETEHKYGPLNHRYESEFHTFFVVIGTTLLSSKGLLN